jgi:hypothetical protein
MKESKRWDEGIQTSESALRSYPTPTLYSLSATLYYQRAVEQMKKQKYKAAQDDLLHFQKYAPPDHEKKASSEKLLEKIQEALLLESKK